MNGELLYTHTHKYLLTNTEILIRIKFFAIDTYFQSRIDFFGYIHFLKFK